MTTARYLSVEAAAGYLGMSVIALRARVARRSIPFIKDGTSVRFDTADLDAYMRAHRVEVLAPAAVVAVGRTLTG